MAVIDPPRDPARRIYGHEPELVPVSRARQGGRHVGFSLCRFPSCRCRLSSRTRRPRLPSGVAAAMTPRLRACGQKDVVLIVWLPLLGRRATLRCRWKVLTILATAGHRRGYDEVSPECRPSELRTRGGQTPGQETQEDAPAGYSRKKGWSYVRINARSGVLPTACRGPQQPSSTKPRPWSITAVRH